MIDPIVEGLRELFRTKLAIEVPAPDTDLIESGLLDSLRLVELLVEIEVALGCRIRLEDIELDDLRSLECLARLVARMEGA
jgi:acyl carrier protein